MIIVNTPHNPVGKVFTRTELEKIAALAEEFNLLVMADEVVRSELSRYPVHHLDTTFYQYDCLVFDNKEHIRIATLPGMWERTVTVGSAGSEFLLCLLRVLSHLPPRVLRRYWVESGLADWTPLHHKPNPGSQYPDRVLHEFPSSRSCRCWTRTSGRAPILRNSAEGVPGET